LKRIRKVHERKLLRRRRQAVKQSGYYRDWGPPWGSLSRTVSLLKREGQRLRRGYRKAVAEGRFDGNLSDWIALAQAQARTNAFARDLFVPTV
jgi:hypothetical protein